MIKKVLLSLIIVAMLALNASATITVTIEKRDVYGSQRTVRGYVTLTDETYATGGFALSAASLGLHSVEKIDLVPGTGAYAHDAIYDYTNEKVKVYFRLSGMSATATYSSADTFFVLDADAAANERPIVIDAVAAPIARLVASTGALGSEAFVFARDSSTILSILDTVRAPNVGELSEAMVGGDTLYFDEDGSYRLYYSGSVLGNLGDLYVPYGGVVCKVFRVAYAANAGALGVPVYFDHNEAEKDQKFTFVSPTDADGSFTGTLTYSYLNRRVLSSEEYTNGGSLASYVLHFIAYGR